MIVSIQNPTVHSSAQSVSQSMAPSFESMLPLLKMKFRKATTNFDSWDAREDAIQEMIAIAFTLYSRLLRRGKEEKIFATPLAQYAICNYFNGRRVVGMSAKDVSAPRCQVLGRATVVNATADSFVSLRTRPSTQACFNLDYQQWRASLAPRMNSILSAILDGYTTAEIAKEFSISPGRVSQIRRELVESWYDFTGGHDKDDM